MLSDSCIINLQPSRTQGARPCGESPTLHIISYNRILVLFLLSLRLQVVQTLVYFCSSTLFVSYLFPSRRTACPPVNQGIYCYAYANSIFVCTVQHVVPARAEQTDRYPACCPLPAQWAARRRHKQPRPTAVPMRRKALKDLLSHQLSSPQQPLHGTSSAVACEPAVACRRILWSWVRACSKEGRRCETSRQRGFARRGYVPTLQLHRTYRGAYGGGGKPELRVLPPARPPRRARLLCCINLSTRYESGYIESTAELWPTHQDQRPNG